MSKPVTISCPACGSTAFPWKAKRFGSVLHAIGMLLIVASLVIGAFVAFGAADGWTRAESLRDVDAMVTMLAVPVVTSLALLLFGVALSARRRAFKCENCGTITPAE